MISQQRYFFVGSEWLYYKLYLGSQVSDTFITDTLTPIAQELLKDNKIDKWFFINYNDPDRHLRIRFQIVDVQENLTEIIQILHRAIQPYIDNRTINKVQIDTYKRELERYGNETIQESESIFFKNSQLISYIISNVNTEDERWLWGLKSIDAFLDAWQLTLVQKSEFFKRLKDTFGEEMGTDTKTNRQLSKKYRDHRASIDEIMGASSYVQFDRALEQYISENKKIIIDIAVNREKANSKLNLVELLESYIHMHCNRLFKSNHRLNEWVVYYFLHQYYSSQFARQKMKTKQLVA
jgi:thiopeptide-type bacteriocin biosynthesis protein